MVGGGWEGEGLAYTRGVLQGRAHMLDSIFELGALQQEGAYT